MGFKNDFSRMASYVLFKELYDDGNKDIYYILSCFIEDVIVTKNLYNFSATLISSEINNNYGFSIPEYVVQSSIKKLKYVHRQNREYVVDRSEMPVVDIDIQLKMQEENEVNKYILSELLKFVKIKQGEIDDQKKDDIIENFYSYLLDKNGENEYDNLISAFIIDKSTTDLIINQIKSIKQGAVLYAGLNYNSSILPRSKWNDRLVVFIETEILFHLAGYNGSVFQELANEVLGLIAEINFKSKKQVINLRYFSDIENEIDNFFKKAVDIVDGNDVASADNYAMTSIINGCSSPSDVVVKKQAFYRLLHSKNIICFDKDDYYAEENYSYNLESEELLKSLQIEEEKRKYFVHLNYVNILRKGKREGDLSKSQYIVLTETGKILKISKELASDQKYVPFAINMYLLTNRLWYDLNKGFGSSVFPKNFDVITRAQIILSKSLSVAVACKFEQTKEKFANKELTTEEMAYTILELRDQVKKPEEICGIDLDDILNDISEEDIAFYASRKQILTNDLESTKAELAKYEKEIDENKNELNTKNEKLLQSEKRNKELLQKNLDSLIEKREDSIRKEKIINKKTVDFIKKIKLTLILLIIIYYVIMVTLYCFNANAAIVGIASLVPAAIVTLISMIKGTKLDLISFFAMGTSKIELKYRFRLYRKYDFNDKAVENLNKEIKSMEIEMKE